MKLQIKKYIKHKTKYIVIYNKMKQLLRKKKLFSAVEIETINRCNGTCSFCPVNSLMDNRPFAKMDNNLFEKIINELSVLNYSGYLGLQSNNEPLLDSGIVNKILYTRKNCPKAIIYMYTNGKLLTLKKIVAILDAGIDMLNIDNYNDNLQLNNNIEEILHELDRPMYYAYKSKIKIDILKPDAIRTNRGGTAPNKSPSIYKEYLQYQQTGCLLPFKQIVIRPTGKVSLCCQDALGQLTLGDVTTDSLLKIWEGEAFIRIREKLIEEGRKSLKVCSKCDVAAVYRSDLVDLLLSK
jgi:radical SAM protein with 4Fe4S-binding SPASM domain